MNLDELRPLTALDLDEFALVVDAGPSMALWEPTLADLRAGLDTLGTVTQWPLEAGLELPPARRLVLVVTDGVAAAWSGLGPALERLAAAGPTAIVQLLPPRMWPRARAAVHPVRFIAAASADSSTTALTSVAAVTDSAAASTPVPSAVADSSSAAAPTGAGSGAGMTVELVDGRFDPERAGVAIPVLALDPRWLGPWAALVAGAVPGPVRGAALFTGRPSEDPAGDEPAGPADPERRVREFRASASPMAFRLAGLLSAAPLTLPVMRLVQAARLPESGPEHLAEVFLGGLLTSGYDFRPGVRESLLPALHGAEALAVVRLVADHLAADLGAAVDVDAAVVAGDPQGLRSLGPAFAAATAPVLRALGGAHAELAEALTAVGDARADGTGSSGPLAGIGVPDRIGSVIDVDLVAGFEGGGAASGGATAGEQDVHVKTLQQVRNAVPPRNSGFVGRDAVLEAIGRRLDSGIVTLLPDARHSLGGTGKTQLALEYMHRFAGEYDLVWWVPAEQVAPMRVALGGLARALKLRESGDLNRTLQALRETLERGGPYRRWLLIFDNASRPEDLDPYLPRGSGHVLVTSRNPRWSDMGHTIEIGAFTRAESVQLLRRRTPSISGSQAHTLAARLGDVPMALEQAAAAQNATGWTATDYLERYDVLRREMGGTPERPEYPSPIVVTWNLAYVELAERNPGAARLLDVCAFLAGEPVSWNVLWESRGAGLPAPLGSLVRMEKALRTALRELAQFGLAQVDPALQSVQVHRLGQLLLLERLGVKEYPIYQQAAHDLLTAADPAIPDDPSSWPRYEELSAHLLYSDLLAGATDESRQLMLHYVRFLFVRGDHDSSRTVAQHAYDRWRLGLGDEHEDTLAAAYHLANAMRAGGDAAEAAKLNQQTLASLRRVFGDDDESTLMTANSVGADLRLRGEFVAARNVDLDNLDRYRRLFGEAYPRTLRCANNLAVDMRLLGDFRQARVIDEQTLMHRRRVLPHPHPETLWSLISLAHNRFGLGEHEVAIEILTGALPTNAEAFGEDHPGVLTGMRYLAMALRRAGAFPRARKEAEATMALWLEKYGPHSADSLSAVLTYANCVRACGEFAAARTAAQQAADGFHAILGERHPFTHAAQAALAAALRAEGDSAAAAELDRHALVGLAHSVGAEHPFSVACAIGYASDLAMAAQSPGAVIASRDTVRVAQSAFGAQHPALLVASFNHALDVRAAHPSGEDRGTVSVAAEALRRRLGDTHPDTLAAFAGRRLEFDIELPAT